ncbi:hypothetical protein ACFLT2_10430 [Acidobacteriota bacterium]
MNEVKSEDCPKCRSSNIISILYGMPTSEAAEERDKGLLKLGGCVVSDDDPQWHCKDCGYEF